MVLGACLWPGQAFTAPLVALSTNAGAPGTTISVPVTLWTDTNVSKLQFDLLYEPTDLTTGTPTGGDALADQVILTSLPSSGTRRVQLVSFTNALLTNGVLVFVPFDISSNAPDHDATLTLTNVVLYNQQNQQLPIVNLAQGVLRIEVPPLFTFIGPASAGGMHLEVTATPMRTCIIQGATQPAGMPWVSLTTNQSVNGQISIDDSAAALMLQRFYRAVVVQ